MTRRVMNFSKGLLEASKTVAMPRSNEAVRVRVGLHTGEDEFYWGFVYFGPQS